jgi:peptidyl-prolyl cis-trans isomerase B (cyclophilin B)
MHSAIAARGRGPSPTRRYTAGNLIRPGHCPSGSPAPFREGHLTMTDTPSQPTGRVVRMETEKGLIRFGLYEQEAPLTTGNFAGLVDQGFYDGLTFHRVALGFVVQGGDPAGDGTGHHEPKIPLEIAPGLSHEAPGVVAMARKQDPNSAGCQFYFTLDAAPHLDGSYAVFGRVIEGIEVVHMLEMGDAMLHVTLEGSADHAGKPQAAPQKRRAGAMTALPATQSTAVTTESETPESATSGSDPLIDPA